MAVALVTQPPSFSLTEQGTEVSATSQALERTESAGAGQRPQSHATAKRTHVSICVCTFRRPEMLADLLSGLIRQKTDGQFTLSIVVVDNDQAESARPTVERFQREQITRIEYFVEREQSIALARNRTVANAKGELLAFIDDDEVPNDDWLLTLYKALEKYQVDGVLGPVPPRFAVPPPNWVIKAGVFERPNSQKYATGKPLEATQTGTGNALIRRSVFEAVEIPFRPQFGSGGEDIDFFRRAIAKGKIFIWCDEAVAYETVPQERTRVKVQMKRALLRGKVSLGGPAGSPSGILKSVVASSLYTISLPFLLLGGRHLFLKYLIKDCDHLGKLLGLFRVSLIREKYVSK
jgi:succinoglycan biosynthesis protein ExoM